MATSVRPGTSRAYRDVAAARCLVGHVIDLVLGNLPRVRVRCSAPRGIRGRRCQSARGPGCGCGEEGLAAPLEMIANAGGANTGRSAPAGASLSEAGGSCPSGAPQVQTPKKRTRSKDDLHQIGLTTTTHPPEVRVCSPLSRAYEVVLSSAAVPAGR